eukprot:5608563-Prymnesium_polylepis.1
MSGSVGYSCGPSSNAFHLRARRMRHRRTRSAIRQCSAAAAPIGFHLDSTSARARLASSSSMATPARNE